LVGTTSFGVFFVEIRVQAVASFKYPKSVKNNSQPLEHVKINHVFGERKPLKRSLKNLHAGCHPGRNHAFQFFEDRLRGFGLAWSRILAFSIDLLRRPYTLALPAQCIAVRHSIAKSTPSRVFFGTFA